MLKLPDYTSKITGAFRDSPKFVKTVDLSAGTLKSIGDTMLELLPAFDLDNATGKQLDVIGEWVGQSRYLQPIYGVFFTWDHFDDDGWDNGIWWDEYSPSASLSVLDDDSYRYILRMYIAANHWRGTAEESYRIWGDAFGYDNFIIVKDYQDMSIDLAFSGTMPAPVKMLLKSGRQPFKPESVRVKTYFSNNYGGPIFGFDIENEAINGFDVGHWSDVIEME